MTSKRAFTLVELLFVTAITAVIIGALGGLFVFTAARAAASLSKNGVLLQAQALSEELDATFGQAQSCSVQTMRAGVTGIKCILPTVGADADGDGVVDKFDTSWIGPTGRESFGQGKRVWFYISDNSGLPANAKTSNGTLWRAWRNDDSLPTNADIDPKFAYYYGDTNKLRWNLIDAVSFTVNADGSVTYTITANKLRRAERRAAAGDSNNEKITFAMTRRVLCKNWRK